MPDRRGLPLLVRAAFAAGFAVGKVSKYWGRLTRELERRAARGPWRTRPSASRSRSPRGGGPSWGLTVVLILATAFMTVLGPKLSQFLPADLLISTTEREVQEKRQLFVASAQSFIGVPYLYGGTDPTVGLDCSGTVIASLRKSFNTGMPAGVRTAAQMSTVGEPVTKAELLPGDLVFFRTDPANPDRVGHVAIYAGSNQIVHANSYVGRVNVDDLNSSYFVSTYYASRRIIGVPPGTAAAPAPDPAAPTPSDFQAMPASDASYASAGDTVPATDKKEGDVAAGPFPDVPASHPNAPAIALLKERGVISGYADGTFKLTRVVSRVELLKFAFLAYNVPVSATEPPFGDVPAAHWGRGYIASAYANGWVSGYGNGDFGPDNTVTRAEAAKIIFNVGRLPYAENPVTPLYADVGRDTWMAPYAAVVKAQSLMESFGVNFEPNLGMKRADVAEFIVRSLRWQGQA